MCRDVYNSNQNAPLYRRAHFDLGINSTTWIQLLCYMTVDCGREEVFNLVYNFMTHQFLIRVSYQGNSGPMVLHKCLALATCIRSKSNRVCLLFTEKKRKKRSICRLDLWFGFTLKSPYLAYTHDGLTKDTSRTSIGELRLRPEGVSPPKGRNSFKFRLLFRIFRQILWKEARLNWI